MMKLRIAAALFMCLTPGMAVGHAQTTASPPSQSEPGEPETTPSGATMVPVTPAMRDAVYEAVWKRLAESYVDETRLKDWADRATRYKGKLLTEEDLDNALNELTQSVGDKWTFYKSRKELAILDQKTADGYVPTGMALRKHEDGFYHIDGMLFNSAAQQSRLKEGDIILSINGQVLEDMSQSEVTRLVAGKPGDRVKVVARFEGADHDIELTLFPPMPGFRPVSILPDDVLYIRLPTFEDPAVVQAFADQLTRVYMERKGHLAGIILDLRYNGGGLLDMALRVPALFMSSGTIVKTVTHKGQAETVTEHRVKLMPDFVKHLQPQQMLAFMDWAQNVPMAVLINGSTASAAEVTTAALKDNKRAWIVGVHSFGKSVGFQIDDLVNGGQLSITTLKYLTPNGRDIVGKGIIPDQVVEQPRESSEDVQLRAAHAYIVKMAEERYLQLKDAEQVAGKPENELKAEHNEKNLDRRPVFLIFLAALAAAVALAMYLARRDHR